MSVHRIARTWRALTSGARRVFGIPDYDAYVAHLKVRHPERAIPTADAFFDERHEARYRAGAGRCC
jgi:uncharacterized short protein YbdD (DUF466 family)